MAKRQKCPKCQGGSVETSREGSCDSCRGRGLLKIETVWGGQTVAGCPDCQGRGKVPVIVLRKCRDCDGTGYMKFD
jgi:DnaJ-class molecular chaperone